MARFGRLGWFLGLIFGAVFGVLFAPRKGKHLREAIKADRKKGNLGISPLQEDFQQIGREILELTKELYTMREVQDIVTVGRKKLRQLSDDLVHDVADFHVTKIKPLERELEKKVKFAKGAIAHGKKQARMTKQKAKASAKVGKKALREIRNIFKK